MFSGIVETTSSIQTLENSFASIKLVVDRPVTFTDIEIGHSISVNGVCLTVDAFTENHISFVVGAETCEVTGWQNQLQVGQQLNVERSLRFGDRLHGHLVTGHVDARARVVETREMGESKIVLIRLENPRRELYWKKGSLTMNGVSLTVNEVHGDTVEFCLIPETLRRTNLARVSVGDGVTVEYDYLAKLFLNSNKGVSHELNT